MYQGVTVMVRTSTDCTSYNDWMRERLSGVLPGAQVNVSSEDGTTLILLDSRHLERGEMGMFRFEQEVRDRVWDAYDNNPHGAEAFGEPL